MGKTKDVITALVSLGVGFVSSPIAKAIAEPKWAKHILSDLKVVRNIASGPEVGDWTLDFEFIGLGGWNGALSADYMGWRRTKVRKGDSDAWLVIYRLADGTVRFAIYGMQLTVIYRGAKVQPLEGPYLYLAAGYTESKLKSPETLVTANACPVCRTGLPEAPSGVDVKCPECGFVSALTRR